MRRERYGFTVEVPVDAQTAERRTRELLVEEGFGVLTEIDVRETLKEKLGAEFRPYRILGACNPHLAHRALEVDPAIGLLLPCNVVLEAANGGTVVRFLDPEAALGVMGSPAVAGVAREATERIERVARRLEAELAP
ncbi:MAG TPA: DUF302 domain-containing protein [Candidatus Dormibacteraeota bacterium]|nr:DUF302 domain-containing protein [Candidatus Dormibacteraeota bacterium]